MTPSSQQQAAIDHVANGGGHLIIEALAGTGKTSVLFMLVYRIGLMFQRLFHHVFMGAYNVSIRAEFDERLQGLKLEGITVDSKTMHAAGLSAFTSGMRRGDRNYPQVEKHKVELLIEELTAQSKNPDYTAYARFLDKLVSVAKQAGVGVLTPDEKPTWEELIEYYSVLDLLPDSSYGEDGEPTEALISRLIKLAQHIYSVSLARCRGEGAEIDFNDMLLAPLHFQSQFKQYDWVMIDEVQDCSAIRQEIAVRMVKPDTGILIGVGDKNQCIYQFSGAMDDGMEALRARMDAKVLPLSVTYRCPKKVVELAKQWVPHYEAHESAPEGIVRTVWLEPEPCPKCLGAGTKDGEATATATEWCEACKGSGKNAAQPGFWAEAQTLGSESVILCRNNRPLVELAYELLRRGIPCQIEGRDFAGSLIKLCQRWKTRELSVLEDRLVNYREVEAARWRDRRNEARAAGVEDKVDTLLALLTGVVESGKTKVSDLVDKINRMFTDTDKEHKPRVLTLSSIHKAKGKEWRKVYILGRGRYMPSRWARKPHEIKAENNIAYVAVTRSMHELVDIVVPAVDRKRKVQ